MAEEHAQYWFKVFVMIILIIYMYGAMSLKYVSGAESLIEAISFIFHEDSCYLFDTMKFNPYYIGIFVFGFLSIAFSFGNIENAKIL
jgi:hypothetical protein